MHTELEAVCVGSDTSVREAVGQMNSNRLGVVLVVDGYRRLLGTITDGDVRRAVLANVDLGAPVSALLARKAGSRYAQPISAPVGAGRSTLLRLLQQHGVLHLPVLDDERRVVGLVTLDEFVPNQVLPLRAVIMAGGVGSRLRPATEGLPKPMLLVGDRPLMEIIIQQLRDAGIRRINVSTYYKQDKISDHFGDGHNLGVEITYVNEDRPLGTAGALGLMEPPRETNLVINGDILTQVDFRSMLAFHREHHGDLTVAVCQYELRVPFGVVECQDTSVLRLTEKPLLTFFVNAGIYLLEPAVYRYIPSGERFDMTDLIQRLLDEGRKVVSFPICEYWLDIGEPTDYERAQQDIKSGKLLK